MPSQSDALSAETKAMRAVDVALQKAAGLKPLARDRVLRYAAEEAAARLGAPEVAPDGFAGRVASEVAEAKAGALG